MGILETNNSNACRSVGAPQGLRPIAPRGLEQSTEHIVAESMLGHGP